MKGLIIATLLALPGCGSVRPPAPHERTVVIRVEEDACEVACARHARGGERVVECSHVSWDEDQWRPYEEKGNTACFFERRPAP